MKDPILALWADDQKDAAGLTPAEIDRRARRLRRRVIRRDAIEYGAGALVLLGFGFSALAIPLWSVRAACVAIVIGTIVVMANLWKRRMPEPPDALGAASIAFYREQLVRQRDALASVWRWYIAPLVPGIALFVLAVGAESARHMPLAAAIGGMAVGVLPTIAITWGIHHLNRIGARRLDAEIAALDRGEA